MAWSVTAQPSKFSEAVSWFRDRFPITQQIADELGKYTGPRAWKIAGVTQLDAVTAIHSSIAKAIEDGTPLEEWKKTITDQLVRDFGSVTSARLDTVFVNANQQSYNAGRWRQMNHPEVKAVRPFGLFDAVDDSRTTQICRSHDGLVMELDDSRWEGRTPQLHHRCRSRIRSIRAEEALRRGGVSTSLPEADGEKPLPGFGATPTHSDWEPDRREYDPAHYSEYERKRRDLELEAERSTVSANQ